MDAMREDPLFSVEHAPASKPLAKVGQLELRDYQRAAVDAAMHATNGVLVLPTGSGKSLVCAGIVNELDAPAVILQPSKEILESNFDKIQRSGFRGAEIYSASMGVKRVGRATYATIGSVINRCHLFEGCGAIIVDEAHLTNAKGGQYLEFIERVKPKRLIGMTATPYRLHTTSFGSNIRMITRTRPKIWNDILHVTQSMELVQHGFLANPRFIVSGTDTEGLLQANSTGAEYSDVSIRRYMKHTHMDTRIVDAVQHAIETGMRHILVFVPTLEATAKLLPKLRAAGVTAASVDGGTGKTEREWRLRDFRDGTIRVMVNVGVLTTGYDFPALDCLVSARPTMSLALYYQIIGRCVRPYPGKQQPVVYDLVDNYSHFGNPLELRIIETARGMAEVLGPGGRLTNRYIGQQPECRDLVTFGKYRDHELGMVPRDYLEWYVENNGRSVTWHQFQAELRRRQIFMGAV